ncbi:MAG TPA: multicopper oxidase domain-containing protein [Rhizomicrobium sp.]|jgi:FtsP/CotA-like multicopper oxidase with cupredoxin domain|nr:multicopper oxidase domain-containing protein [Rhizomicrobium sp.]
MRGFLIGTLMLLSLNVPLPVEALANGGACPRPAIGSEVVPPPDLYSADGVLDVSLDYFTSVDDAGRTLFCFVTPDGMQSPTLHVKPGDTITIHLTDQVPNAPLGESEIVSGTSTQCGAATMTPASTNIHFHGLNASPRCHSDETIHTLVNSRETFDYQIKIPANEPPGLYWYHQHVHGLSSPAVQGGASGLIEVEGIANLQPAVSGLPERFLILRDEPLIDAGGAGDNPFAPFWDVSLNYITVPYPKYTPAIIAMHTGTQEFWRVANAAANTIMDLKVLYDGVAQPLQIVAFDGVPTGSQDGKRQGRIVTQTDVLLPPAGRVEFIVTGPPGSVKDARFVTERINGGPASDSNPMRPLALIRNTNDPHWLPRAAERTGPPNVQRFEDLADAKVTASRLLYFIEIPAKDLHKKAAAPAELVKFYIAVDGEDLQSFDPDEPPQIVTNKGAVEEWTIQNRSPEVHEFHIHQIHFLVEEENGVPIPRNRQQFYDTHQVGFWDGIGPWPYIKVRMDFRGAVTGDFVYHCHILDHEDAGMMAVIRVLPKALR